MKKRFTEVNDSKTAFASHPVSPEQRFPVFWGIDSAGSLTKVSSFSVLIIGLGSIGRSVAEKLARMGIGRLFVVDPGRFKKESLLTHSISRREAIQGKYKAQSAALLCKEINPRLRCFYLNGTLDDLESTVFLSDIDLIILATDNIQAEISTDLHCVHFSKPLLHCAVHGESLLAQIRFFTHQYEDSPCICCSLNDNEMAQLNSSVRFSCDGSTAKVTTEPTRSTAFLCSLAADFGAMTVLRYILRLGTPMEDYQYDIQGFRNLVLTTPLHKSSNCKGDHSPFNIKSLDRSLSEMTLREVSQSALVLSDLDTESFSFNIDGMHFVVLGICACGKSQAVRRFCCADKFIGKCTRCQGKLKAHPFFSTQWISSQTLQSLMDRPLHRLGVRKNKPIKIRQGQSCSLVYNKPLFTS